MARGYFQSFVPETSESEISTKRSTWGGINKKMAVDSGEFSSGKMFIPHGAYIESAPIKSAFLSKTYGYILGSYGVSNFMLVVYKDASNGANIYVDYITSTGSVYTSTLSSSATTDTDKRYITQFNVYSTPLDPLSGTFARKLLIYPDKVSMDYTISAGSFALSSFAAGTPNIKHPVVHLSRLFGVDDERVYASEFNDYTGWDLDTGDEYLESNAWATTSQSNTKADGLFTAITSYDNHVYCFKDDFMHQVNNTKNPFRLIDVGEFGCVNNESVVECAGYLFFVSKEGVNLFSGGYPKIISTNLNISDYSGSKLASFDNILYFYNDKTIYTYDITVGAWGVRDTSYTISAFVTNTVGVFAVTSAGIYNLNSSSYPAALGDCEFVTDLMALGVTDVKRLKRLSAMINFGASSEIAIYAVTTSGDVLLGGYAAATATTRSIRIITRKLAGDYQQLKFKVKGYVRIYSLILTYSKAGGRYDN